MRRIDPKHVIIGEQIVKESNGTVIPEDEPLMLFRARDRNVLPMLRKYRALCIADGCNEHHMQGVANRIEAFEKFAAEHPDRMKQPGVTRGL
jgi:hypothetical protein